MDKAQIYDNSTSDPAPQADMIVQVLINQLYKFKNKPRDLERSWAQVQAGGEDAPGKAFSNVGFTAWFAYHVVKCASDAHHAGNASLRSAKTQLETGAVELRKRVAEDVAHIVAAKQDILVKINKFKDQIEKRPKKRRRETDTPTTLATSPSPSPSEPLAPDLFSSAQEQVYEHAQLQAATDIFPRELSTSIRRIPHPGSSQTLVAAINMAFSNLLVSSNCQMTIEIAPEKVEHLAWVMFGVRLETMAGLRCATFNGSKIIPSPRMTLRGLRRDSINIFFGDDVGEALIQSHQYQADKKACLEETEAVSLVVSHVGQEPAVLYLFLGEWKGTEIRKKLYPE